MYQYVFEVVLIEYMTLYHKMEQIARGFWTRAREISFVPVGRTVPGSRVGTVIVPSVLCPAPGRAAAAPDYVSYYTPGPA